MLDILHVYRAHQREFTKQYDYTVGCVKKNAAETSYITLHVIVLAVKRDVHFISFHPSPNKLHSYVVLCEL